MPRQLIDTKHWPLLQEHAQTLATVSLLDLFGEDSTRASTFCCEAAGLLINFSKQKITQTTLTLLCELAKEQQLPQAFQDLFAGRFINKSENRPAYHPLLRSPLNATSASERHQQVQASLHKMAAIVSAVHSHQWRGFSGKAITDIVNLGIGGSYLGPALVCEALRDYRLNTASGKPLNIHFVANIDIRALEKCLEPLNPETTLFLVSSKSFTTLETMTNFVRAKKWLAPKDEAAFQCHFIAITAYPHKALAQGFSEHMIIPFWDWVGGRYSLWSAIGLPIALSIGMTHFHELLAGAHSMDHHVSQAAPNENAAIILALLDLWQINCHHIHNHAILSYHDNFSLLTSFLQQLIMESNGKSHDQNNNPVPYHTAPIVWGGLGPLGQHAYYQLLHQGTVHSMIDFILVANTEKEVLSSALSQAQVLMEGDATPEVVAANLSGNKPSTAIWLTALTPQSLGALIALYEHRIFAQAMLWNINPFDQWGVERGKAVQSLLQATW